MPRTVKPAKTSVPYIARLRVTTTGNTISASSERAERLRSWLRSADLPNDRPVVIQVECDGEVRSLGPLRIEGRRYYRWGTGNYRTFEETLSDLCELAARRSRRPVAAK